MLVLHVFMFRALNKIWFVQPNRENICAAKIYRPTVCLTFLRQICLSCNNMEEVIWRRHSFALEYCVKEMLCKIAVCLHKYGARD